MKHHVPFVLRTPDFAHELAADLAAKRGAAITLSDAGPRAMARLRAEFGRIAVGLVGTQRKIFERFERLASYGQLIPELVELRHAIVDDLPLTAAGGGRFGAAPAPIPGARTHVWAAGIPEWLRPLLAHLRGPAWPKDPSAAEFTRERDDAIRAANAPTLPLIVQAAPLNEAGDLDYSRYVAERRRAAEAELAEDKRAARLEAELADIARREHRAQLEASAEKEKVRGGVDRWLRGAVAAAPSSYGRFAGRVLLALTAMAPAVSSAITPAEAVELLLADLDDQTFARTFEACAIVEPTVELNVRIRLGLTGPGADAGIAGVLMSGRRRRCGIDFDPNWQRVTVPRSQAERILADDALEAYVEGDIARATEIQAAHDKRLAELEAYRAELEAKLAAKREATAKRDEQRVEAARLREAAADDGRPTRLLAKPSKKGTDKA